MIQDTHRKVGLCRWKAEAQVSFHSDEMTVKSSHFDGVGETCCCNLGLSSHLDRNFLSHLHHLLS